jgi:hypothetical protein
MMIVVQTSGGGALYGLRFRKKGARPTPGDEPPGRIRYEQVIAAALAYGYYVAAALMAGAQFPEFLRDHLFDGFGPAVLVGFLIYRFNPGISEAATGSDLPPRSTFLTVLIPGAAVMGLIAAAAVFSSGLADYFWPVFGAAFLGGSTFPLALSRYLHDYPAASDRAATVLEPTKLDLSRLPTQPPHPPPRSEESAAPSS